MGLLDNLKFTYCVLGLPEITSNVKEKAHIAGEKIVEKYNETSEKYNEITERCSEWSDEQLIRKYKNCSNKIEKLAYYGELKNRGLISNNVNE